MKVHEIAPKWEELGYTDTASLGRRKLLIERILRHEPDTALDIGCGPGGDMALLKLNRDMTIWGIDGNDKYVEEAAAKVNKIPGKRTGGKLFPANFTCISDPLEFPSKSFDIVYSNAAIMYAAHPRDMLFHMHRIAKKAIIMLELPTIHLEKALQEFKVKRTRVPYDDIDIVWRNFGFLYEIVV